MTRIRRLLNIIQDIRLNPDQSLEKMLETHQISRSQFYKDKKMLASLGFQFEYRKGSGFQIQEDQLTPITDISLSDRIVLLFALECLCACGDGLLAAKALEVGRKLAGALEKPFCQQMLDCFDAEVMQKTYGVRPEIFQDLLAAVRERSRIRILYRRSGCWTENWRTVDPRRIYMRERSLYLYARTADESPPDWKVFRLNRIQDIEATGISFSAGADDDDGFRRKIKNAFSAFLGDKPRKITVRFSGPVIPYIRETMWHPSQVLENESDGSLLFTVCVAEPEEVVRWSQQFGEHAQVLEIERDDKFIFEKKKKQGS